MAGPGIPAYLGVAAFLFVTGAFGVLLRRSPLIVLLSPFAPHIAEELWGELGHAPSILSAPWPQANPQALARDEIEIAIQVCGKLRGHTTIPTNLTPKEVEARLLADAAVQALIAGKTVHKVVVVPGKLVNIVAT